MPTTNEKMQSIAQNPDATTSKELLEFVEWVGEYPPEVRKAISVFGYSSNRKKHTRRTLYRIKQYCQNLLVARGFRLSGQINKALQYENLCEQIYQQLPKYARW